MLRIIIIFECILIARNQLNVLTKFLIDLVDSLFILFVQIIMIIMIVLRCFVTFFLVSFSFQAILNFTLLILL